MSIFDTTTLLTVQERVTPLRTFLRDRYFPRVQVFTTDKVLIETNIGSKKMAPFVLPRQKGITVERGKYQTSEISPAYITPQRTLTADDVQKRQFGEALYSNMSVSQREAAMTGKDISELNEMIDRREEWMAAQLLNTGGVHMRHYADKYNSDEFLDYELRFYEDQFDNVYIVLVSWNDPNADIVTDLSNMLTIQKRKGAPATDLIVSSDVAMAMLRNEKIIKLLDVSNYNIGKIDPKELTNGTSYMGSLNVMGRMLNVFTYDEYFQDDITNKMMPYIPSGRIMLAAPDMGYRPYAKIVQMEGYGENAHMVEYHKQRVPKVTSDTDAEIRTLKITSRPAIAPYYADSWLVADVLI